MTEEERKKLTVPICCPICEFLMKGKSTNTYYDWGCCMSCFLEFIDGREQRWRDGWRPKEEQLSKFVDKYGVG
jgi:hypothetical protein